ncbi:MAG: glycosyltransferase family 9 protein [Prevotellaceae bacterium]|nr:glycosyltransferase family 9 protein [Prevotellaceae bacterium]
MGIKNILVVRFRQMGDAIIATALLNTLRSTFPNATIDFVLNDKIASLFEGHPSINNLITFTNEERYSPMRYVRKVWRVVHNKRYDVIIDLRSTVNTMIFALLSPRTKYRIGKAKGYTHLVFNHTIGKCPNDMSMVDYDISYASALAVERSIKVIKTFTLHITPQERENYAAYMQQQGVNLNNPVMLANVTAKLTNKIWNEEYMIQVIDQFISAYPDWQIIFNYAPGQEETNARRIYQQLGSPAQILIDVKARSARELVALGYNLTCFFGNEGGARHIMQAVGCPSFVICAPGNSKDVWIAKNEVLAEGIAPSDFASAQELAQMTREQQYALIKPTFVWAHLQQFIARLPRVE